MYGHCTLFDADHAAAVLLNRVTSALNLTVADFTTQLSHQFIQLANAGRAKGVFPHGFASARAKAGRA